MTQVVVPGWLPVVRPAVGLVRQTTIQGGPATPGPVKGDGMTASMEQASVSNPPSEARPQSAASHGLADLLQLVSFVVGAEEFAIPILSVQEINRMMPITRVPQSPPFIVGVINLRGKIIPVMDLRRRFGMPEAADTADARIIVVEVAARVIGFTVDRVNEVLRIGADIVEPPPNMVCGVDADYVEGVGKLKDRLLILLSLERLFGDMAQEAAACVAGQEA